MVLGQSGAPISRVLEMTDEIIFARQGSGHLTREAYRLSRNKSFLFHDTLPERNTNSKTSTRQESHKEKPKTTPSNE